METRRKNITGVKKSFTHYPVHIYFSELQMVMTLKKGESLSFSAQKSCLPLLIKCLQFNTADVRLRFPVLCYMRLTGSISIQQWYLQVLCAWDVHAMMHVKRWRWRVFVLQGLTVQWNLESHLQIRPLCMKLTRGRINKTCRTRHCKCQRALDMEGLRIRQRSNTRVHSRFHLELRLGQ